MRIAILGATREIAKDLILTFAKSETHSLALFARRPETVKQWLNDISCNHVCEAHSFDQFQTSDHFDAIINFVGVGNPAKTAALGAGIFDITSKYDDLALQYVEVHPNCKYIFLSSGAAYCSTFDEPANENTKSSIDLNHLKPQDWYGVAKLHAECRHRAMPHLAIVDVRVFNYFSHTQNMSSRFLITDIIRAIRDKAIFETSNAFMMRDYLHPSDFYQLVKRILNSPPINAGVDCYSKSPIDKHQLLSVMAREFSLTYKVLTYESAIQTTGSKPNYYSMNQNAFLKFKYEPRFSSEEAVIEQTRLSLKTSMGSSC